MTSLPTETAIPLPQAVPTPGSQGQQALSEAQNDLSIASLIIAWSGLFLAIAAGAVTLGGFFGVRELGQIRRMRLELEQHVKSISTVEQQFQRQFAELAERFEREGQTFMEASYNYNVGVGAYKKGDNVDAIDSFKRALRLQPKDTNVMTRIGRAYTNLDNTGEAIKWFENALRIDPQYAPAILGLSICYRFMQVNRAIEYCRQAVRVDPLSYESWDYLGLLYRDVGHIDEAIAAHEHALSIHKRPDTEAYLGILYAQKGDLPQAKRMMLDADMDSHSKEFAESTRPVWGHLYHCAVCILEGNKDEAITTAERMTAFITTRRVYMSVIVNITPLLTATQHEDWLPPIDAALKVKLHAMI